MTGPNPNMGGRKQIMNKSEIKLIAALSNIDLGNHRTLTLKSALTIADKLRSMTVQEFCNWLNTESELTFRIVTEYSLEGDLRDAAIDAVSERLLEIAEEKPVDDASNRDDEDDQYW